jgi:formylglycine-generating enzyme required for sulfatase activity
VGSKKPNDLGLFDMQGNVYTWCQERYRDYPAAKAGEVFEDNEDILNIYSASSRVLRGGSYYNHAVNVRSALRYRNMPSNHDNHIGLRPARTLAP